MKVKSNTLSKAAKIEATPAEKTLARKFVPAVKAFVEKLGPKTKITGLLLGGAALGAAVAHELDTQA